MAKEEVNGIKREIFIYRLKSINIAFIYDRVEMKFICKKIVRCSVINCFKETLFQSEFHFSIYFFSTLGSSAEKFQILSKCQARVYFCHST